MRGSPKLRIRGQRRRKRILPALTGLGGEPDASHYPLQLCEGDCDEDSDCDFGLQCFQREGGEAVPGCTGNTNNNVLTDYCIEDDTVAHAQTQTPGSGNRQPVGTLAYKGNGGFPRANFPLGLCEGDCDSDAECVSGLICLGRNANDPVPGCQGTSGLASRTDFCVLPPTFTWAPTWSPTKAPTWPPSSSPTKDPTKVPTWPPTDSPTTESPTSIPTAIEIANAATVPPKDPPSTPSPSDPPTTESPTFGSTASPTTGIVEETPTAQPSQALPELQRVGNNNNFLVFPLQHCMGDCDSDLECAEGLMCWLRTATQPVPGCSGLGDYSVDYCINPPPMPTPPPSAAALPLIGEPTTVPTFFSVTQAPAAATGSPTGAVAETATPTMDYSTGQPSEGSTFADSIVMGSTTAPSELVAVPVSTPTIASRTLEPTALMSDVPVSEEPTIAATMDSSSEEPTLDVTLSPTTSSSVEVDPQQPTMDDTSPTNESSEPTSALTMGSTSEQPTSDNGISLGSSIELSLFDNVVALAVEKEADSEEKVHRKPGLEKDVETPAEPSNSEIFGDNPPGPLGLCQGSCSNDSDCLDGLTCFKGNDGEAVPECAGRRRPNGGNYCAAALLSAMDSDEAFFHTGLNNSNLPYLQLLGADDVFEAYPLEVCQGSCFDDGDCRGALTCFQRDGDEPVPGCQGLGPPSANYCISNSTNLMDGAAPPEEVQEALPNLHLLGADGVFDAYPLGACQGSCFNVNDCSVGLVCFQRDGNEPVPGCAGLGHTNANYCVHSLQEKPSTSTQNASFAPAISETESTTAADSDMAEPGSPWIVSYAQESEVESSMVPTMPSSESATQTDIPTTSETQQSSTYMPTISETQTASTDMPTTSETQQSSTSMPTTSETQTASTDMPTTADSQQSSEAATRAPSEDTTTFLPSEQASTDMPTTADSQQSSEEATADSLFLGESVLLSAFSATTSSPTENETTFLPTELSSTDMPTVSDSQQSSGEDATASSSLEADVLTFTNTSGTFIIIGGHASISALEVVGNDNVFEFYPLTVCKGDCDADDDCAEGLRCFQRRGKETVPGCDNSNGGENGADYCIYEQFFSAEDFIMTGTEFNSQDGAEYLHDEQHEKEVEDEAWETHTDEVDLPTKSPTMIASSEAPSEAPSDDPTAAPTHAPTKSPTKDLTQHPTTEFPTASPTDSPTTAPSGGPTPTPSETPTKAPSDPFFTTTGGGTSTSQLLEAVGFAADQNTGQAKLPLMVIIDPFYPLGECTGDCNFHSDCAPGLFCYHRNDYEMPVPGCAEGHAPRSADFCVSLRYYVMEEQTGEVESAEEFTDSDAAAEAEKEDQAWDEAGEGIMPPTSNPSIVVPASPTAAPSVLEATAAATMSPSEATAPSTGYASNGATSQSPTNEVTTSPTVPQAFASTTSPTVSQAFASTMYPSESPTLSMKTASPTSSATLDSTVGSSETILPSSQESSMAPTNMTSYPSDAASTESPSADVSEQESLAPTNSSMTIFPSDAASTESPSAEATEATTPRTESLIVAGVVPTETNETLPEDLEVSVLSAMSYYPSDAASSKSPSAGISEEESLVPTNSSVTYYPSDAASTESPSAEATNNETSAPSSYMRTYMPRLIFIGNDGVFDSYPLQECHGDCDHNDDCEGDLMCMQRIADEAVPGCRGIANYSADYCVKAEYLLTDTFRIGNPQP